MRNNAYMATRKTAREIDRRVRTAPLGRERVREAAASADRLATQLNQLNEQMNADDFRGSVVADGTTGIAELLKRLHGLVGKLTAAYYSGAIVPESVPETDPNTRKIDADSRVSPQPSEGKKPKKSP